MVAKRVFAGLISAMMAVLGSGTPASAQAIVYPPDTRMQEIATNGTTLHVRVVGAGPAVVLLHGYGETGDMWAPLGSRPCS